MVALLTRSLGQREADKGSIRLPFRKGCNQQVVSTGSKIWPKDDLVSITYRVATEQYRCLSWGSCRGAVVVQRPAVEQMCVEPCLLMALLRHACLPAGCLHLGGKAEVAFRGRQGSFDRSRHSFGSMGLDFLKHPRELRPRHRSADTAKRRPSVVEVQTTTGP